MNMLYVFRGEKLVGMQDVTSWPVEMITASRRALLMIGRTAEVSDKGRATCCVCFADLGERELPAGQITHGYCDSCLAAEADKIGIVIN